MHRWGRSLPGVQGTCCDHVNPQPSCTTHRVPPSTPFPPVSMGWRGWAPHSAREAHHPRPDPRSGNGRVHDAQRCARRSSRTSHWHGYTETQGGTHQTPWMTTTRWLTTVHGGGGWEARSPRWRTSTSFETCVRRREDDVHPGGKIGGVPSWGASGSGEWTTDHGTSADRSSGSGQVHHACGLPPCPPSRRQRSRCVRRHRVAGPSSRSRVLPHPHRPGAGRKPSGTPRAALLLGPT